MNLSDLIPDLMPLARSLSTSGLGAFIKGSGWAFPLIQNLHLLALMSLGGAAILTNLRLMGGGLLPVPAASTERSLRPLLWGALIVLVVTGLLMALVLAPRLYVRPAYLAKMVALAAALVLTFGAVAPAAAREGVLRTGSRIAAAVGVSLWLASLWVFGFSQGSAPGTFHMICAAWLLAMAFGSSLLRLVLGGLTAVVLVGVGIYTYGLHNPLDHYDLVMDVNRWTLRLSSVFVTGCLVYAMTRPSSTDMKTPARLLGAVTLLAWVTTAAAGRWIGLGGGG